MSADSQREVQKELETQVGLGPTASDQQLELDHGARCRAVTAILKERARQDKLKAEGWFSWTCADQFTVAYRPIQHRPIQPAEKLSVLSEEFGEVSRVVAQSLADSAPVDEVELQKELTQVAAVCLAWLEALDGVS